MPSKPSSGLWGPLVPAAPLLQLIAERIPEDELSARMQAAGVEPFTLTKVRNGARRSVSFMVADKIITTVLGDPGLWERVPELRKVYHRIR